MDRREGRIEGRDTKRIETMKLTHEIKEGMGQSGNFLGHSYVLRGPISVQKQIIYKPIRTLHVNC